VQVNKHNILSHKAAGGSNTEEEVASKMGQVWRMVVHLAVPPSYFEKECCPIDYDSSGNQGDVSWLVDGKD